MEGRNEMKTDGRDEKREKGHCRVEEKIRTGIEEGQEKVRRGIRERKGVKK